MMRDAILVVHIVAGVVGLLAGPSALLMRGPGRVRGTLVYFVAVTTVAVTASLLVVTAFDTFWWLLPVAVGTQVAAAGGGGRGRPDRLVGRCGARTCWVGRTSRS